LVELVIEKDRGERRERRARGKSTRKGDEGTDRRQEIRGKHALITNLLNLEQPTLGTHIALPDILYTVHNRGAHRKRDTIIVRLAYSTDARDVGAFKDVLSEV
jgi:hypothetical protein